MQGTHMFFLIGLTFFRQTPIQNQGVGNGQSVCKETLRKHSGNTHQKTRKHWETLRKHSRERPKIPRKRSGNTHAKDLKHPGNAQETLTRKT